MQNKKDQPAAHDAPETAEEKVDEIATPRSMHVIWHTIQRNRGTNEDEDKARVAIKNTHKQKLRHTRILTRVG